MNPIYNTGIRLYRLGVKVASGRNPKAAKMLRGHDETLRLIRSAFAPTDRPVWIHASSLGEFEQGRPLIERLRRERPATKILLTFFSPSGYEVRRNFGAVDCVAYLPFDTPANARSFVEAVNPSMAIFVKYEFWGNYLEQLSLRRIPTYLISAIFRPGQAFFRPWGGMMRRMLRCFTRMFVQDEASLRLLDSIGITDVEVAGDTRFDRVTDILRQATEIEVVKRFAEGGSGAEKPFVLIAGSSWEPDEAVYAPWVNASPDNVRLIVAPHEFDEERIGRLAALFGPDRTVRFSEAEADPSIVDNAKCLIIDCFGKLSSIYRYGSAAYIGGGFGAGIHNINEAAVYGIPVIFGPNHSKFKEAADLIAAAGGFEVGSANACASLLTHLTTDPAFLREAGSAAGSYISRNLGATDRIWERIFG